MTSGEIASLVSVIGLVLSLLGVTGIDSSMLGQAINGVVALISVGAAVFAAYKHRQLAGAVRAGRA